MIVDVRLVVGRDGTVRVRVDGRPVAIDPTSDHAQALLALARAASGVAWTEDRTPGEVLADPASALFTSGRLHVSVRCSFPKTRAT